MSLRCTATFVICFHLSLLLAFSLHFSSSSGFLRSFFTQSSHRRCGLPRFLQPSCFFVSDLFGNLSSFILTMCPAHFIRLLTILPTLQANSFNFFSQGFHASSLHSLLLRLFPLSSCSHILVVYVVAVRTELTSQSHMY